MQLWAIKRNDTIKTESYGMGDKICRQARVIKVTKTKQKRQKMPLPQGKQSAKTAKMNVSSTTANYTAQRTITTPAVGTNKTRLEISQPNIQMDSAHVEKWLASRPACDTCPTTVTSSSNIATIHTVFHSHSAQRRMSWIFLLFAAIILHICHSSVMAHETERLGEQTKSHNRAMRAEKFSQLLSTDGQWAESDENNSFRPIIPKDISPEYIAQNVFTKTGQYRVFEPPASDLRIAVTMEQKGKENGPNIVHNNTELVNAKQKISIAKALTKRPTVAQRAEGTNAITQGGATQTSAEESTPSIRGKTLHKMKLPGESIEKATKMPTLTKDMESEAIHTHKGKALQNPLTTTQQAVQNRKLPNSSKANGPPQYTSAVPANLVDVTQNVVGDDMKELEALLVEYAESFFNKAQFAPSTELVNALQRNHTTTDGLPLAGGVYKKRPTRHASASPHHHHHHLHHHEYQHQLPLAGIIRKADGDVSVNIPRAMESGRLLFFAGLKKALWPIFMGLQVLKSLLFALFLPTLIGSFGKLLGKGIVSGSAPLFIRPADAPQDLDFRDNTINFDDDKFAVVDEGTKEEGYAYNQAEASQTHYTYNPAGGINRIEQQNKMPDTYLSAIQTIGSASFKNSGSLSGSLSGGGLGGGGGLGAPLRTKPIAPANTNTFQTFQKVPTSSLLLSNYDPFYSPLLSRLDSVFAQLKLNSDNENCREKLICLMYANPAKYAPYSNLVSAQLSRELNELRKPTSDNPDILRFFKYMRAAKDGQDGIDCEKSFDRCTEFKDFENPAMVSTYHDINKLVQARKLT
ncbi:uncharacterized protein LOC129244984 [Anastrepha obliqua]|uniref:uncharacterized protein LOC129244984 n=1 Tax=Anastrepha obliqua TaxID=95512 RepID=UPI002409C9C1|nr:uncharacterized protein LOC129244984 [Anastrepha obliqua]XP_054740101.1 uncharacterized protein LOC129244984 [Anastrepha obliqua]